jgi:IS5 family transposase
MSFLGFPNPFPDSRTIWLFRERMAKTGKDEVVWGELQKQLDAMGLKVKRGTIQDATFIEADPGKSKKASDGGAKVLTLNNLFNFLRFRYSYTWFYGIVPVGI